MYPPNPYRDRDDYRTVCDNDGDNCRQVPYEHGYTPRPRPYQDYSYLPQEPAYVPSYRPDYDDMPYTCDQDGDDCRPNSGYQGGYNDLYGANPQSFYAPVAGERLVAYRARLQAARANAVNNYRMALASGQRARAKVTYNFIQDLNHRLYKVDRQIAAQGGGGAYAYSPVGSLGSYAGAYTNPNVGGYNQYGYGSTGLYSAVAPLLGNFVP